MNSNANASCAKRRLALSSSTAVLAMLISAPAMAQAQTPESVESVTVSSSRIMSSGFDAPTPTTVINADELVKQANTNVFVTITELPSVMGSTGTTVGNGGSSNGVNGLSALDIRGLGTQRNLIMIDGERVIPTSSQGVVDISQFPSMLLQRVDVVTGGASASWGSDAVSGVVNFILDRKFEGFKMNLNGGITDEIITGAGVGGVVLGRRRAGVGNGCAHATRHCDGKRHLVTVSVRSTIRPR